MSFQQRILENFIVIWLDPNINKFDTIFQHAINQLQSIVDIINIFVEIDQCIDYLTDIKNEKVFMILSGSVGEELLPFIKDIHQLYSIYIFSNEKAKHEKWIKDYYNVRGIFIEIESLCDILKRDIHRADIDLIPISIVPMLSTIDLNQLDQSFMYSQLIKEILLKMKYDEKSKKEFCEFCRLQHGMNNSTLRVINEFEENYEPKLSIQWYTRDCFLYPMLNKALRTQDIEIILKIGFFFRDLHQQIQYLYSNIEHHTQLTVYRGQGLSNVDFEKMIKSQGGLLSFNNFLSTSLDRQVSLMFAESARENPELIGIFFQIDIDPSISTTPFALLDTTSYFSDEEQEILFSVHTIFRIDEIKQIDYRLWEVKLKLTNDNDEHLKCLTDYIRKEIEGVTEWEQLGHLMMKMGELNKAEEIFNTMLEFPPHNDSNHIASLHANMGFINAKKGDPKTALSYYENMLEILQKSFPSDHPHLASLHLNIGWSHQLMGNYPAALEHFEKSLNIWEKTLLPDHPNLATAHNNIGTVHRLAGKYSIALIHFEKALEIQQKSLPKDHPDLATSHNNLGLVYKSLCQYSNALFNHKKTFQIQKKTLSPNHPNLAMSYLNIGDLYRLMKEYTNALICLNKAMEIFQKCLPSSHSNIALIHNNLALVYESIEDYRTALSHYEIALQIWQISLPSNHPELAILHSNIGIVYQSIKEYSKALLHFEKSLEIEHKSTSLNYYNQVANLSNIAVMYKCLHRYDEAIQHVMKAIEIATTVFGSNHRQVETLQNQLEELLHAKS